MTARSTQKDIFGLIISLLVTFAASAVGAIASVEAGSFYGQMVQPTWAPPARVFAPVWTALFALMAAAAWLVWRSGDFRSVRFALALYLLQLCLNAFWSWLFFAWHQGALALAEVIVLWVFIATTLIAFWRVRPLAGLLLVPYLAWVSFATALNYALWQLNPDLLG